MISKTNLREITFKTKKDLFGWLLIFRLVELSFDGVPPNQDKEEGPPSPTGFFTNSKVQAMAQIVEKSQTEVTGLYGQNVPDFVHLIT